MSEVKIEKENVLRAYKNGCDDVKDVLKDLFPDIAKEAGSDYLPEDILVTVRRTCRGDYFEIDTGESVWLSRPTCVLYGDDVLVPFSSDIMFVTKEGNFRLKL